MADEKENTEVPALDVNALLAPEGTDKDNQALFAPKEENIQKSSSSFNGLPNLDPKPEAEVELTEDTPPVEKKEDAVPPAPKPENEPFYVKQFKAFHKKIGGSEQDFKLPEGITEENYLDKYDDLVLENTEFEDTNLHPDVKAINDLVSNGMPVEQAIKTYQGMNDLISLPDDELVKLSIKQRFGKTEQKKDGWDEDKINKRVEALKQRGDIEIEAETIRDAIRAEKQTVAANYERTTKENNEKQQKEYETVRNQEIGKSIEYIKGMKDIYGISVSKAELQEFQDDFRTLVMPNDKGEAPINLLLRSNENLVKFAFLALKGDQKVKDALTKAKEGAKKSTIDKLDDTPTLVRKSAHKATEGAIDLEALVSGERQV